MLKHLRFLLVEAHVTLLGPLHPLKRASRAFLTSAATTFEDETRQLIRYSLHRLEAASLQFVADLPERSVPKPESHTPTTWHP